MGPTFSVTSMRPSGRKASRQGSSKLLTVVMVKGRLASGFSSPILTWDQAATDARVKSNAAFANFIVISPSNLVSRDLPGRLLLRRRMEAAHVCRLADHVPIHRLQQIIARSVSRQIEFC